MRVSPGAACSSVSLPQVGERFRSRALKFPGLISGCTMDWFQRWPKVSSHGRELKMNISSWLASDAAKRMGMESSHYPVAGLTRVSFLAKNRGFECDNRVHYEKAVTNQTKHTFYVRVHSYERRIQSLIVTHSDRTCVPQDALIAVADHFLSKYDIECTEEVKRQVIQSMGIFHDGVSESCLEYFIRSALIELRAHPHSQ